MKLTSQNKTIWILQTGEPLHIDAGNPRPMRAMNLSNHLVEKGHRVVLWTSAFYHQEKRHRNTQSERIQYSDQLEIRLIPSPGYNRNIGFGRLWDHAQLAKNLKKLLRYETSLPDVAFIGYPPIETAAVMTRWLSSKGVPCLLDIKDQWPSLFLDALPERAHGLAKMVLSPYYYYAKRSMREATGIVSMANSFLAWGLDFMQRGACQHDAVFPLTSPSESISEDKLAEARRWWDGQGIVADTSILRLVFIGSHMSVFDFAPIRDAALALVNSPCKVEFIICGDGGSSAEIRAMLSGIPNVYFPGWIDRPQIEALAERSQGALTPYKNIDNFTKNLPNKVIDALSLGLPILSPLQGEVMQLIDQHQVGLRYGTDSGASLSDCINFLLENEEERQKMKASAQNIYQEKFSYTMVYDGLVEHLEKMAE